ncbi:acyltransferase [Hymenobacter sp. BT18]|uniref:acyltransferase family protein n=1 Tax=Hymenobacter sp. BT18 TaxID=2835648 RepID=UPI00143E21DE|nr:acyltransferase [Hymenobacter sp. BT18]QIX60255.1 acyltransferase [Hymenobacter sp. BT18]
MKSIVAGSEYSRSGYLPGVDMIRFTTALAVVLFHFVYSCPRILHIGPPIGAFSKVIRYGYITVDIFFMISGYMILKSARHKSLREFVVARAARLYPVYWLSCLLTFAGLRLWGTTSISPVPTTKLLLVNLTMLQEFFGQTSLNGVFWTLTVELAFYFLVAMVIGCRLWSYLLPLIFGWLAVTMVAGPEPPNGLFKHLLFPGYSPYVILGMLLYLYEKRAGAPALLYTAMLLAGGLAIRSLRSEGFRMQIYHHDPEPFQLAIAVALFFGVGLLLLLSSRKRIALPGPRIWATLGKLTYSLYLLHNVGVGILLLQGHLPGYIPVFLALAFVMLLAWGAYRFVEVPGGNALQRLLPKLLDYLKHPSWRSAEVR